MRDIPNEQACGDAAGQDETHVRDDAQLGEIEWSDIINEIFV